MSKKRVLILCTGNSCRSQMAEGFLRARLGDFIEVESAGIEPHGMNQTAIKVMAEKGIDISGHTSKSLEQFTPMHWDLVITVCDSANEHCPIFPNSAKKAHVGFDDPPKATGTEEEKLNVYRRVRDEIDTNLVSFVKNEFKF